MSRISTSSSGNGEAVNTTISGSVGVEVDAMSQHLIIQELQIEGTETKFNDIQNVIKEKIFNYLDFDELQIVRTVCRSWYYLINKKFGIKAVIDNRNIELAQTPWIVSVQLLSLTRPLPTTGMKCGNRLQELYFRGIVVSYNLIPLLQYSPRLQSITFDDPTLDLPDTIMKTLTPTDLSLPSCESIELLCWSFSESLNTILSVIACIEFGNLHRIHLRSVHPPMVALGLLFLPFPRQIDQNLNPLMKVVLLNLCTLEEFSVGTLIAQNKLRFVIGSGEEEGNVIQLKELELINLFASWTSILENQRSLEQLSLGHFQAQQWGEVRNCLRRCERTLVRIELRGRSFGVPWECDIFENCSRLELLHLNLSLTPKRLLARLPVTLTELTIDGPVEIFEVPNLFHLSSLRKLVFCSLGLNLLVLFPGNQEEGEENADQQITLNLFVNIIIHLVALETLSFKDCSQDALTWSRINNWCQEMTTAIPGVTFHDHSYDIHGQRHQHGLTLKLPLNLDRGGIKVPLNVERTGEPSNRFLGVVRRIFGI